MALGELSSSVPSEAGSGSRDTAGLKFGPSSVHPALKLPAFSWLISARVPGVRSFLVATGNAEKNLGIQARGVVIEHLPSSSSSPTWFVFAQTKALVFAKFGVQCHI